MKINIPWSNLTNEQKTQLKSFYEDELKKKELFEHDLNKRSFPVNNGNIVFKKDF